jgi:hypothetical protein
MTQKPRTIHPGDTQEERLARLPLSAAYTYAYLPTVLDDEGRAKDQPAVFNGFLWPLRAEEHGIDTMARDIAALVEAGLLCRYSVGENDYLHDPNWKSRQKIARPIPSTLPGCPMHDKSIDEVVAETLTKVSEQINAFLGTAAASIDETRIRDGVARIVEDVTFLIDPEKAAAYGQKVRGLFNKGIAGRREAVTGDWPRERQREWQRRWTRDSTRDSGGDSVWRDTTDQPPAP